MVVAFGACTHVIKPFGSPWRRAVPTLEHIGPEGDTCDYHALRLSHDHILRHPAQRRVVFAITDGQGDMDRTRAQRMSGEALGIQHLGIGIQEDCSYTWGPQSVTINTPADLGRVAFQQLRRAA